MPCIRYTDRLSRGQRRHENNKFADYAACSIDVTKNLPNNNLLL
jgi:hypothetical protein